MIPKEKNITCSMMMYGKTFYGHIHVKCGFQESTSTLCRKQVKFDYKQMSRLCHTLSYTGKTRLFQTTSILCHTMSYTGTM